MTWNCIFVCSFICSIDLNWRDKRDFFSNEGKISFHNNSNVSWSCQSRNIWFKFTYRGIISSYWRESKVGIINITIKLVRFSCIWWPNWEFEESIRNLVFINFITPRVLPLIVKSAFSSKVNFIELCMIGSI